MRHLKMGGAAAPRGLQIEAGARTAIPVQMVVGAGGPGDGSFRRMLSCSRRFRSRTSSGWNVPNRSFQVYIV